MSIVSTSNRYCMPEILELKATTILPHRREMKIHQKNAQNFYKACFVRSFTLMFKLSLMKFWKLIIALDYFTFNSSLNVTKSHLHFEYRVNFLVKR